MVIGLSNVKLSVGKSPSEYIQKPKKARPSIAEDAIFIPKPKKRVSFEPVMPIKNRGGGTASAKEKEIPLPGSNSEAGEVPLPGDGSKSSSGGGNNTDVTGIPDKLPALGENGISAKLTAAQYSGEPAEGYVKMEIDYVPEKDRNWDAPQEEGRQINNHQVPFQLQYDSYGRPRIGFSREPYDFAATKYIELTSKIKFNQNVGKTIEHFRKYFLGNNDSNTEDVKALFAIGGNDSSDPHDISPLMGAEGDDEKSKYNAEIKLMSDNSDENDVTGGKIEDKKEFEKFFFNDDKETQEEELKKGFLGKEISTGENNKGDTDIESVSEDMFFESDTDIFNTPPDSGYKTQQYELASNKKPDNSQFSLKV